MRRCTQALVFILIKHTHTLIFDNRKKLNVIYRASDKLLKCYNVNVGQKYMSEMRLYIPNNVVL